MTIRYLTAQTPRKVIKSFVETSKEDLAKEGAAPEDRSVISFAKPAQDSEPWSKALQGSGEGSVASQPPEGSSQEQNAQETPSKAQERQERRSAFKRAADLERRALNLQKQAQEQLSQTKAFQELIAQAKQDPTVLAKAVNLDPQELYRLFTNKMLSIPDEPVPVDEKEEIKARLHQYEQERQREREQVQNWQAQTLKQTYMANKILPVLADTARFELINANGKETCASLIYDLMDAHFRQTREELDASKVAEEMENQLFQEMEPKVVEIKKLSKFSKHFQENQETQLGSGPKKNEIPGTKQLSDDMAELERLKANRAIRGHHKIPDFTSTSNPVSARTKRQAKLDEYIKNWK